MLSSDVIELAKKTKCAAPIVIPTKKNGSPRFCLDCRKLDDLTHTDSCPTPRIDESIDLLRDAKIFSTLNVNRSNWHVQIKEEDRGKLHLPLTTAFYCFVQMPFVL